MDPLQCRKRRKWDEADVISEIRHMARTGSSLAWSDANSARPDLVAAACSRLRFGSWQAALAAAGIEGACRRKIRRWDRQSVVAAIELRKRTGLALNAGALERDDPALLSAGRRQFGSWNEALTAAGLDPAAVARRLRLARPRR